MSTPDHVEPQHCSVCGVGFHCGAANGGTKCWCDGLPKLSPVEERDCLCPACLAHAIAQQPARPEQPLIEGEDYYAEGGTIVFTAQYHLRRGYCCGRGCRHCPYR
jgi:hypothetical protein